MVPDVKYTDFASDVRLADLMMLAAAPGPPTTSTGPPSHRSEVCAGVHEQAGMPDSNISVDMIQVRLELL